MCLYKKRMKDAQDNDKVIFYDYLSYKRAAGWWSEIINDGNRPPYKIWHRPSKINRAKYCATFLQNLPDYYFLGVPIKELIKSCNSGGYCYTCALALSLCFDEFEIIICNLENYRNYYNQRNDRKIAEFEHTFIVIDVEGEKTVIDTTFGMISDYETYKHIFNINKIRRISSKDLKNTEIYQYIQKLKYVVGPSYESELCEDESYREYISMIYGYITMCKNYSNNNNNNNNLQDFINRCLYRNSVTECIDSWRMSHYLKSIIDYNIQYPIADLFSLDEDEFDLTLERSYKSPK